MSHLPNRAEIVVVGAGVTGLSLARTLRTAGRDLVLLEQAGTPGGLLAPRLLHASPVDGFYHHLFVTDSLTMGLLEELGLAREVVWRLTSTALLDDDGLHPLTTPLDIARFRGLSMGDKARLALLIHRARGASLDRLDGVLARDWVLAHAGEEVWDRFLGPLVEAKFGPSSRHVSAAWLAGRIGCRSSRGLRGERLGYLVPGFHVLVARLAREVDEVLWCSECVTGLLEEEGRVVGVTVGDRTIACDHVVFTGGLASWRTLLGSRSGLVPGLASFESQCIVCGIFALEGPTRLAYWTNVTARDAPFNVVVHQDPLAPGTTPGIVYASRYVTSLPEPGSVDRVLDEFQKGLQTYFDIPPSAVTDRTLAMSEDAGIVYATGTWKALQSIEPPLRGLHLAGMLTSFPDRSIERSVASARTVESRLASS